MKSYLCWIWVKNDYYLQKIYKEMGRKDTARLRYWLEIIFKLSSISHCFQFLKKNEWHEIQQNINPYKETSLMAQRVKNLPAVQETQEIWVWFLGQEEPWRRKWQPTPVFLPEKSQGQRSQAGGLRSMWYQRVGHDWATEYSTAQHKNEVYPNIVT